MTPLAIPSITPREIDCVTDSVTGTWYGNAHIYHTRFEQAFASYIRRKYAVARSSAIWRSISVCSCLVSDFYSGFSLNAEQDARSRSALLASLLSNE